jgi:hypothetical protein
MFGGRHHIGFVAINAISSVSALTVMQPTEHGSEDTMLARVYGHYASVVKDKYSTNFSRRLVG